MSSVVSGAGLGRKQLGSDLVVARFVVGEARRGSCDRAPRSAPGRLALLFFQPGDRFRVLLKTCLLDFEPPRWARYERAALLAPCSLA